MTRTSMEEPLSDYRVIEAAFSDDVIKNNYASELIRLPEQRAIVVKKIAHEPVTTLTLEQKQEDITQALQIEKAKSLIADQGASLFERLQNGEPIEAVAESIGQTVSVEKEVQQNQLALSRELIEAVFTLSQHQLKLSSV